MVQDHGPIVAASGGIGTYNHLDMVALAKVRVSA